MSRDGVSEKGREGGRARLFGFEADPGLHLNLKSDLTLKKVADHCLKKSFPLDFCLVAFTCSAPTVLQNVKN